MAIHGHNDTVDINLRLHIFKENEKKFFWYEGYDNGDDSEDGIDYTGKDGNDNV